MRQRRPLLIFALALLCLSLAACGAKQYPMQIAVVNRSTYPIADIRISLASEEGWGENRLETTLEEGESVGIDLGEYTEEQLSAGFHLQFYGEDGQPVNPDYDPSSSTFFENGDFLIFSPPDLSIALFLDTAYDRETYDQKIAELYAADGDGRGDPIPGEGIPVLTDVNFALEAGSYLCIVGENGSGKSTLVKGLLHLKNPSTGSITTGDGLHPSEIGYLPQQTAAQKDFPASVWEVVLSGRQNHPHFPPFYTKADKEDALRNMELLDLLPLKKRCYRDLSGGQQQRVLLARALCATKKLLLLDEPVTGLDPVMTNEMYQLIRRINREQNVTIIMVSHDIRNILPDATHILQLDQKQVFFGPMDEYLKTEAGKQFLGGADL